jgi:hypothetical protein
MPTHADFLGRGMMPKEAPTPFNSRSMAQFAASLPATLRAQRGTTELSRHMLARPGLMARPLGIPHPHPYFRLTEVIADNWVAIDRQIQQATISVTKPIDDPQARRAVVPSHSMDRTEQRAEMRALARYVLHADVAQCYPSIYTHSLAWAMHGKAFAKTNRNDPALVGNALDRLVRSAQDGQTVGIPVGPDTSLVLAELVLSQVDVELESAGLRGFRYIDDYELYFGTYQEAERGLSTLVRALASYELNLNSQKTGIDVLPQPLQDEWVSQLRRTELRFVPARERSDLTLLFDDAFRLASLNPGKFVVSYALGRLGSRLDEGEPLVHGDNWSYLQRLLLQACWAQPTAIQKALTLLRWGVDAGFALDRDLVEKSINALIVENAHLGHGSELAWALWVAISLRLRVRAVAAKTIEGSDDDLVALTALHLWTRGLLPRGLDVEPWRGRLTPSDLEGPHWLLSFEAAEKTWLTPFGGDHIAGDPVFATLRASGVTFYDAFATVPATPPHLVLAPVVLGGLYA